MRCPSCDGSQDIVLETRNVEGGTVLKRRRECTSCGWRFSTYERAEGGPTAVLKRDKRREPFDQEKLRRGIELSITNLELDDRIDELVHSTVREVSRLGPTVSSRDIGKIVEAQLRTTSPIAFIRFASVFRRFSDPSEFDSNLSDLGGHLLVQKRNGMIQLFSREKIRLGIVKAATNTELDEGAMTRITESVVKSLDPNDDIVQSEDIGRLVLDALKPASPIAYMRFRNVFERFTRPQDFAEAVQDSGLQRKSR